MTFLFLSNASHSRRLPSSSVTFLLLRPPCAPPPEPPSPPTPPEPTDPPDSQICFTFADSYAQSLSSSSLPDLVSLILHISSAISESPSPTSSITDFFSDVFLLADDTTFLPQYFPQVCSYSSPYVSSKIGRVWLLIEFVALVLWNLGLSNSYVAHLVSIGLDTFVLSCSTSIALMRSLTTICGCLNSPLLKVVSSQLRQNVLDTFVLSCSTSIALMRSFTAVCGFYLDLFLLKVVSSQLRRSALISDNLPVFLVHWGFHSPHLSFMELFILSNTSLVFSDKVTGSIVCNTNLLEVKARIVVQDCSRSAFADCLTLVSLEALFPPYCGFDKIFQAKGVCFFGCSWLVAALLEPLGSPLSPSLFLSIVVVASFRLCSISMFVDVLAFPTCCCYVVSSVGRD
ncbi:unnamed protein product [Arabidopsis thaliana]|uniref:Uncharacterized protein n=1 Tax=Arabidopsis thaliana TaxID=3702 RepID=A0A5S9WYE3_ARATH|nr:unnamed protein product [Arabidopsis thaliana]